MTQVLWAATGKLTGRGEICGPDGKLKAEFTISADCTPEQAEALARDISLKLDEDDDNGCNAR